MSQKIVIGLTGGIASGKTTAANYLAQKGAYVIDADVIAREVVKPNSPTTVKIAQLLGKSFLLEDGHLNRAKIKQLIFNDQIIKKRYEAIILPAIRQQLLMALKQISEHSHYTLLVVPLLFEKGLDKLCDYTLVVDIPSTEQVKRAINRLHSDQSVIEKIINAQMPRKERNHRADFIVCNDKNIQTLHHHLDDLHEQFCKLNPKTHDK